MDAFETIFTQFGPADAQAWKNKIIQDLKGGAFEQLISEQEGIEILPFYTLQDQSRYQLDIPAKANTSWLITEKVKVRDMAQANQEALKALQAGAQAILFDVEHQAISAADAAALTKDILLEVAPVHLLHVRPEDRSAIEQQLPGTCPQFIEVPLLTSTAEELVYILQQMQQTTAMEVQVLWKAGSHYFMEIAKLRALRWLWLQAGNVLEKQVALTIVSETGLQRRDAADEYTNMLRNTTEAMSAVAGGCDALIIGSHDISKENTEFGKRIARNIHHILQFESYFNELADAAKGSYYIEYLTYQLAQRAWESWRK